MTGRKIKVLIQEISLVPPSFMIKQNPVWDITDRIPEGSIKEIVQKTESGRFAFTASDLTISGIVNSDDFFSPLSGFVKNGIFLYVKYNDTEIYRGYAGYGDFCFYDANPKTASFRAESWLSLLKKIPLENFRLKKYTIDDFFGRFSEYVRAFNINPSWEMPVIYDISLPEGLSYSVHLGDGWFDDSVNTSIKDVWRSPKSGRVFGVSLSESSDYLVLYELFGQGKETVAYIPCTDIITRARTIESINWINIIGNNFSTDYVGVYMGVSFTDVTGRTTFVRKAVSISLEYSATRTRESTLSVYHLAITDSGEIRELPEKCFSDGFSLFTKHLSSDGLTFVVKRWTLSFALIGETMPFRAFSKEAIFFPSKDLIVFYESIRGKWKFFRWDEMIVIEGDFLPSRLCDFSVLPLPEDDTEGGITTETVRTDSGLVKFIPFGYDDDRLNGRWCLWLEKHEGRFTIRIRGFGERVRTWNRNLWWTNDPVFLGLSSLRYGENVNAMDVITDFALLFNSVVWTNSGKLYVKDRGLYARNHFFSTEYISQKGFQRALSDNTQDGVPVSFNTKYIRDDVNNPYSNETMAGVIRAFYRDIYNVRFIRRIFTMPVSCGFFIETGDLVHIRETSEKGTVIKKTTDFEQGTVSFELEDKE
jgi:hypothetical protein